MSDPDSREIADAINILGAFCGMRDIPALKAEHLSARLGVDKADVMVLFGGSILAGGGLLAKAIGDRIAKIYVIVGGEGHTTGALRQVVRALYPDIHTESLPEAQVFDAYLARRYDLRADYLECESTNCGNNITNLLALLKRYRISCESILLMQDATMQRRMDAGLRKYAPKMKIINYATYRATVVPTGSGLAFRERIPGMWDMDRYITLLLGEIPRLMDDLQGYGPKGRGFVAHVDVPEDVVRAFRLVSGRFEGMVRVADHRYGS